MKKLQPSYNQARWQRQSVERQQAILDRAHQHTIDHQAETTGRDHHRMQRWTKSEDEAILDPDAPPDHELALELGRTLYAVRGRRVL